MKFNLGSLGSGLPNISSLKSLDINSLTKNIKIDLPGGLDISSILNGNLGSGSGEQLVNDLLSSQGINKDSILEKAKSLTGGNL